MWLVLIILCFFYISASYYILGYNKFSVFKGNSFMVLLQ